jgi:hypothetical protein
MIHQIIGWAAVAVGAFIVIGTLFSRHGMKESMTSIPIGLLVVVIGLWQLGVVPLGDLLSSFTGVGKR